MKDDKFNKLMEKYVDSTKRGKDTDLQKLNNRSDDTIKGRKGIPKYIWVVCTMLIVVIVSLSIVLPIVLNKEEAPELFYCDDSQIQETEVKEIQEFKEKYNIDCLFPSIEYIESYMHIMTNKEDNQNIGLFIELAIFNEKFDGIKFNVIKKQYVLKQLQYFDAFTDSIHWKNTIVRYQISDYDNDNYYSYAMTFSIDSYNYFINFDSFSEMSATEALNMIYGDYVNK